MSVNDKFKNWNPMEMDYQDEDFNQYVTGPGADLDDELQPARMAQKMSDNKVVPTLVFKFLPKGMTTKALQNICSKHGRVREVRDSRVNPFYFVDMATVADMEAVFRALENNNYGFKVIVGKENKNRSSVMERMQKEQNYVPVPPKTTGIDFERRTLHTSQKNLPRPKILQDSPLDGTNLTNIGLPLDLIENDAHALERQGLIEVPNNNNFRYRNGRSFLTMPEKTKEFMDKKHKESSGEYNENDDKYSHVTEGIKMPNNIAKCSNCFYACDTVCERCSDYYCSIECQRSDWPNHRYKCGKPKLLQLVPPAKRENQADYNSSEISKQKFNETTDFQKCEEITLKGVSLKELTTRSKTTPGQLQSKKTSQQNSASPQITQQLSNSQQIYAGETQNPCKMSSSISSISSKPSAKRLPAALKAYQQNAVPPQIVPQLSSQKNYPEETQNPYNMSSLLASISSKSSAKRLPAALKNPQQNTASSQIPQQPSNFQNISAQEIQSPSNISSSLSSISSKPSVKRLPAALRMSSQHHSSLKSSVQKRSDSPPTTSQNSYKNSPDKSSDEYNRYMPRSGSTVVITSILKANIVFIRSTTSECNLSFIDTVDTLQLVGKNLRPLTSFPKIGEIVVVKFDGQYNRAQILAVRNQANNSVNVTISFLDYGNAEQVTFEDLLEAPQKLKTKPRHAIPVYLKDVNDITMTQEIREFMYAYLNDINVEIRYMPEDLRTDNNIYTVELIDEITEQNLNKIIVKLSKPLEPSSEEVCDRDYLEKKILPRGKNVVFKVMDNSLMCSGCISCTIKPYADEIEKFKKDIQEYVKSIPEKEYTPRVNELCVAKYEEDDLWYRGVCLEIVGDGYPSIHFLDYGNITMVPIKNIRRYPRQFTYPIYTADCAIDGLPESCEEKTVNVLENLIPNGEEIKCENVTFDEESHFYTISLPDVIGELTKLGLINM